VLSFALKLRKFKRPLGQRRVRSKMGELWQTRPGTEPDDCKIRD
jgi:hypothetical protein